MRCTTCGDDLEPGTERCRTCGAVATAAMGQPLLVQRCPRCNYRGEGTSYFSRSGHVALLVVVSLVTSGVGGIGGLFYWLARRKHSICPNCGRGWGESPRLRGDGLRTSMGSMGHAKLPPGGASRRVFGALLALVSVFLVLLGVLQGIGPLVLVGAGVGVLGGGSFLAGAKAREKRRDAVMAGLQQSVLQLATRGSGTLTVTEVAADLNLSLQAAEKVLMAMDDGFRVRSEITDEGILLYEFPEVQVRRSLEPGADPS